jgi:hypothetical protein
MKSFFGVVSTRISSSNPAMTCGFTARITVWDCFTSSRLSRVPSTLCARLSLRTWESTGSATHMSSGLNR